MLARRDNAKRDPAPLGLFPRQRSDERILRDGEFAILRDALQIRGCDQRFHENQTDRTGML